MRQKFLKHLLWLMILPAVLVASCEQTTLGEIEFFGYKGLDTDAVRKALPFREGDKFPPAGVKSSEELKQIVSERIARTIGTNRPTFPSSAAILTANSWPISGCEAIPVKRPRLTLRHREMFECRNRP